MSTEEQLKSLVESFLNKLRLRPSIHREEFCCAGLREQYKKSREWPSWADMPGVYYILGQHRSIVYVGAGAAWYGVVHRVETRIKQKSLAADTKAVALLFGESDWYWVWSLEAFLIDSLKPQFNDRIR